MLFGLLQDSLSALLVLNGKHALKDTTQLGSVEGVPSVGPDSLLLLLVLPVGEPVLHADSPVESLVPLLEELEHLGLVLILDVLQLRQVRLLGLDGIDKA